MNKHNIHEGRCLAGDNSSSDLDRDVFCLLGLVIDSVGIDDAVCILRSAAERKKPYLMSTPNVNFLVNSLRNQEFRDAVLDSDLCVADGMPLVWISRFLGLPILERVAGSDIFERLKKPDSESQRKLSVFFFGGADGVGRRAGDSLNSMNGSLRYAGSMEPGFGSIEDMSHPDDISSINESNADFLVVALGAVKGHLWLEKNKNNLHIPIRSHLGAVINFESGKIGRAPGIVVRLGLEWLWRIKEEPRLWRRYWSDGLDLTSMFVTKVLPLATRNFALRHFPGKQKVEFSITSKMQDNGNLVSLSGEMNSNNLDDTRACFKNVTSSGLNCVLDLAGLTHIDSRCLGTIMMLRKILNQKKFTLKIINTTSNVKQLFRWHGIEFILPKNVK